MLFRIIYNVYRMVMHESKLSHELYFASKKYLFETLEDDSAKLVISAEPLKWTCNFEMDLKWTEFS